VRQLFAATNHGNRRRAVLVSSRRVLVWRNKILPYSETFIRDQAEAMTRWTPVVAGLHSVAPGITPQTESWVVTPSGRRPAVVAATVLSRSRRLSKGLLATDAGVVHAHFGYDASVIAPFADRAGIPLIVTFHGYDVTEMPTSSGAAAVLYRRRLPSLFARARVLIAVSDFVADRLRGLGAPERKVVVRHIGIPVRGADPGLVARSGILFVGRLVEKKGVADLLEAVALLPGHLRSTPVRVVGDGPLRTQLEAQSRALGLEVTFAGVLSSEQVRDEMSRAVLFCGPSKTSSRGDAEGYGLVFLEAALGGLPSVAYRHGGVVSAVEDGITGLLAEENDVQGLSQALRQLLLDRSLAERLGKAGRARVVRDLDVTKRTADLEDLYDEVAGSKTGSC